MRADLRQRWLRPVLFAVAGLMLALVFAAYQNPHTVLDLASRVWACF